jgi:oligo-1,6-glucosidase
MRFINDFGTTIVEAQLRLDDPNGLSVRQFWQRGSKARKTNTAVFVYGDYEELDTGDEDIFAYLRTSDTGKQFVVVLNFSGKSREWTLPSSKRVQVKSSVAGTYTKGRPNKALLPDRIQLELGACGGTHSGA